MKYFFIVSGLILLNWGAVTGVKGSLLYSAAYFICILLIALYLYKKRREVPIRFLRISALPLLLLHTVLAIINIYSLIRFFHPMYGFTYWVRGFLFEIPDFYIAAGLLLLYGNLYRKNINK